MKLLLLEIWVYLLFAFLLGMFIQWFFCCRGKKTADQTKLEATVTNTESMPIAAAASATTATTTATPAVANIDDSWRPSGFDSAPEDADELKRIKGIGAVIEATLNELGIYKFEQIAEWNSDNIAWVENSIAFPGRIQRENWLSQAKTLSEGGTTEFAKRVDTGEIDYKS